MPRPSRCNPAWSALVPARNVLGEHTFSIIRADRLLPDLVKIPRGGDSEAAPPLHKLLFSLMPARAIFMREAVCTGGGQVAEIPL